MAADTIFEDRDLVTVFYDRDAEDTLVTVFEDRDDVITAVPDDRTCGLLLLGVGA